MAKIAPSILSADFANLGQEVAEVKAAGAEWLHFDVMDGSFVPNITIGLPVLRDIRRITDLPLDVHLMIERPIRYAERFIKAGADWLTIHLEADTPQNTMTCLEMIRAMGCKAGLSIKPGTPMKEAVPYLTKCDMILVMTVEPGFGGQSFMTDMMEKTRRLRKLLDDVNPACLIEVDGGIDAVTQGICKKNGVDVMVTGSAYFKAADRAEFVKIIQG